MALMDVRCALIKMECPVDDMDVVAIPFLMFREKIMGDHCQLLRINLIIHVSDLIDGLFRACLGVLPELIHRPASLLVP